MRKGSQKRSQKLGKTSTLCFDNPGPFQSKEESLEVAPPNKWFAEKYSVGGHPSCRTCNTGIKQHQLCIRWEKVKTFINISYSLFFLDLTWRTA